MKKLRYLFFSAHHRKPHVSAAVQDPDWEAACAHTARTTHPCFNPGVRSKPAKHALTSPKCPITKGSRLIHSAEPLRRKRLFNSFKHLQRTNKNAWKTNTTGGLLKKNNNSEFLKYFQVGKKKRQKYPQESFKCSVSVQAAIQRWGVNWERRAGQTEVEHCCSCTRPARTHAHTHAQGVRYITGHSSAQLTENPNSCVAKFCPSWLFPSIPHRGRFSPAAAAPGSSWAWRRRKTRARSRAPFPRSHPFVWSRVGVRANRKSSHLQQETHSNLK